MVKKRKQLIEMVKQEAKAMASEIKPGQMSPLEYLLQRINDPTVPATVRDRLALAAAPFCHPRLTEERRISTSAKAEAEKAAKTASIGTEWADDLGVEIRPS